MDITYENLKPILVSETIEGNVLKCIFKTADQPSPIEAQFVFTPDDKELVANAGKQAVKRSLFSSLVSVFTGSVSSAVGGGVAGSAASSAVSGTAHAVYNAKENPNALQQVNITEEKKKQGVVNAFKNVQSFYVFEKGTWRFKQ